MTRFLKNADVTGYISQTSVTSSLLKTDSAGKLVAAVAGTDYATPGTIASADKLIREVYNKTGATLTKGTVVYINDGQGNLPAVTKAIASGDSTSAQTFGIVQADITNNNNGYVVIAGGLDNMNTQGLGVGTALYLSSTTAGEYTTVKQSAPNHLVYIGVIVRDHPTQGVIEVRIQNGYELEELHNVAIASLANNHTLVWESATSLWKNKTIAAALGYTPADDAAVVKLTGNQTVAGVKTFTSALLANNPSEGATGEGLIAGQSFKIDATGTGQRAIMYVVSKTLSNTYGSGLIAQYANSDGDKAFGFNLNTAGGFELYVKNTAFNRALAIANTMAATFGSSVTATSFIKSGGTSAQFLKADGSVDGSTYLTSYTETDTLATVTGRGNTTTTRIGVLTSTAINLAGAGNSGTWVGGVQDATTGWSISNNGIGLKADDTTYATVGIAASNGILYFGRTTAGGVGTLTSWLEVNSAGVANFIRARPQHNGNNLALVSETLQLAGGTLTGRVTFPSTIANRPQFPGGILGLDTGDGNFDIWGISREYYPSNPTAADAWGIRWNGNNNDIEFVGAGNNRVIIDLDNGNVTATTFTGALSGNATSASSVAWTNVSGRPTVVSAFTNDSGYITSSGSISGSASRLSSRDNRTISPSEDTAAELRFGFTSWTNNDGAPYADYLHMRSYQDNSGGSDNLVMFLKSGIGMRIWQQSFGSGTAYSSYVDVLHSSNFGSYALPLTGGTLTGNVIASGDTYTTYGPNSTWTSYLRVGGNGRTVDGNAYASVVTTNGNLHIDAGNSRGTYINFYAGTLGIAFGNGASGVAASVDTSGNIWKGGTIGAGTQYVFNSGTWGINVTGSAGSVAWTGVSAGIRENYDLQFRPSDNSNSYAGLSFASPGNSQNAGYLLVRGGGDNDVYTQNGITIVADLGWLTLAQRTTAGKGVRIMTGTSSSTRFEVTTAGATNVYGNLTVNTGGTGTWGPFVVTSTSQWGDGGTQYVTIGAGGAAGIMINNPHIVWNASEVSAAAKFGRSGGVSTGSYYVIGTGASNNFFITKDGALGSPQFNINSSGNSAFSGTVTAPTFSGALSGTASGNVVLRGQSNWNDSTVIGNVVGMLAWKNYGNGHVIFDASQGTTPSGGGISTRDPVIGWTETYPTLMGWNGGTTFGVRVDSARVSDNTTGNAATANQANSLPTRYDGLVSTNPQQYFNQSTGVKVAMTGAWSVWSDTLWINGYAGGDVLQMCALHTLRNGQPRMAISVQASNSSSYGTYHEFITTWNIANQTVANTTSISSAVGGSYQWTNIQYFLTNNGGYLGSTDSAKLQAYSTGNNSAFMSFHKAGNYAVNFGLDADNVMRIGGWSAAANRWQLDMSGNQTVAGSSTATSFFESSDSRLKTLIDESAQVLGIENLQAKLYEKNGKIELGYFAQEAQQLMPYSVNENTEGYLNLSYREVHTAKIARLEKELEELKAKLN